MTGEELLKSSNAYKYVLFASNEDNKDKVPKYVRLQAKQWLEALEMEEIYFDYKRFKIIRKILKLMRLPDAPKKTMLEAIDDYGYFMLISTLCTRLKKDDSRLYQNVLLEIARKNHKTFISAIYLIVCMIFDVPYSRYFSVAPSHALSREIQLAVQKIVGCSPNLQREFKCTRDYIRFKDKNSEYIPLAYSGDSLDGKLARTFIADEVGLLPNNYPIQAMLSSQIELIDKAGILISTKYPTTSTNVLEEEVDYCKSILEDNKSVEKRYFSLLYEPDEELLKHVYEMESDEQASIIYHSNPNAINNEKLFEEIKDKIVLSTIYESRKENTLTKHLNILYQGSNIEQYMTIEQIRKAFIDNDGIDFKNKRVYMGLDLAEKHDNTSLTISYYEDKKVYSKAILFVAEDTIDEKSRTEKVDYRQMIKDGDCIIAGDYTCDYNVVCEYIDKFVHEYGCIVDGIGYDPRNASMLVYQLENKYGYPCIEVMQHSSVLSQPLKLLRKMILDGKYKFMDFGYITNNFINAKEGKDNMLNIYLTKKKSTGKIDIVFSTIDCFTLLLPLIEQDGIETIDVFY